MKLLLYPVIEDDRLAKIVQAAGEMAVAGAVDEAAAVREIADADAFFGKLTPEMLAAATRLRWVQSPTASLEHYVFPALVEHPLVLTNMRGIFSDVIADHVMGYVICLARNFHRYIRNQAERRWAPEGGEAARVSNLTGPGVVTAMDRAHRHLAGSTMGIVGLGSIGAEIARRAAAFNMRVVAVDPARAEPPPEVEKLWKPGRLDELLAQSDWIVVAAPHTPETEKMFRRPQFQKMRLAAYFINIGRGAIVELADLTAALEAGEIAGAALDVFEQEPLPPEHPLWRLPNVILTPHVAGYATCIADRHLEVLLDNIRRFAAGEPLRNVVNKRMWF
ncbi:MAG: D-2-hydroxyacid dehydrogenase [Planctomycetes bacterium]|nr:D-2-hydroxyacid dehydrogenase [Planctomycetota bacterium]